ncbi:uncharacterized protein Dwil_GK15409 [Drosophila willistoni]|uniref:Extensin n=1 Tax=Drosophila willistoni TaxID=7260 RepID=B4MV00_DROWI|nr:leucine-rich repeat extensin-like protein 3 [Drosophila willistoni]EDW76345.1 uncharacterized protein Dwil_GK15409 [Drosophila willistoni]
MYNNYWLGPTALCLMGLLALAGGIQEMGMSNSIALTPGQPMYYLMADAGRSVGPNDELKRTNRSLWKWWDDLFAQNNCCNNNNNNNNVYPPPPAAPLPVLAPPFNNNCNGLQNIDPFKQIKLFKKLPDLFGNTCSGQCNGNCGQQQQQQPGYGADGGYGGPPQPPPAVAPANYDTPNPAYDGPGDGDAGYVAPPPAQDSYVAPAPAKDSYVAPPPSDSYVAPSPPAADYKPKESSYNAPAPPPAAYEEPAPVYDSPAPPASESYGKGDDYAQPAKSYGGSPQPPQIVYQPIIYLSAPSPSKVDVQEQNYQPAAPSPSPIYQAPPTAYAPPAPAPPAPTCGSYLPVLGVPVCNYQKPALPAYEAPPPAPSYAAAPVPPPPATPSYATPSCQTPIRLSLIDQPYRVAPELFDEYHYRLSLADQNRF